MENKTQPIVVILVLRDVLNLMLQERYLFGDGSSEIEDILERLFDEQDVVGKYGQEIVEKAGRYVLGNIPAFREMAPLLEKFACAVRDISEKADDKKPFENEWQSLGDALRLLEVRFGKEFPIPRTRIISDGGEKDVLLGHHPTSDHEKDFRVDSDRGSRRPPLSGGMETVPA